MLAVVRKPSQHVRSMLANSVGQHVRTVCAPLKFKKSKTKAILK